MPWLFKFYLFYNLIINTGIYYIILFLNKE